MQNRPKFIKPNDDDILYPKRNKDGVIETLVNPNADSALTIDGDARTSFVYNRYHHLPLETQRLKLPVFQYKNHILYLLEKYQTLVLIGETGCGKSTQVPQYLYEIGHKVCVTQPRVTAAMSLACRVAEERGELIGDTVGYAAGMTSAKKPESGIVFMTEGVLLREMFANPLLMQYSCIVFDEVHERTQMTDVLMGLLKKIAKKRKNLKIIVSSATMDAEFLRDFFNLTDKKERDKSSTSVILSMQGRTHPIDVFYVEEPVPDYVKATVDTVIKIHENEPLGNVLAFLTSQEEIHTAIDLLSTYVEENNAKIKHRTHFPSGISAYTLEVVPMYGSLPHYRQASVCGVTPPNVRRVILATNVAETALTIPHTTYVIDCGFHKLPYFSPSLGVESVAITPISRNNATQRQGRSGRTARGKCFSPVPSDACGFHKLPSFSPALGVESVAVTPISRNNATQRQGRSGRTARGKCFRLYTEEEYLKLPASVPPEMCRSDLSSVLLLLKALGIHNLLKFTFPTPPPAKSLLAGLETLYALKAIDKHGNLTEDVGVYMAELPLKPMCAKMLCNSGEFGCIDEILSITAMLQVDSVFIKSSSGKENISAKMARRNNFEVAEGDIIMYLNVYDSYIKVKSSYSDEKRSKKACKDWCHKMYLNYRVMEKASEIRSSLEKLIKDKFKMENKIFDGPDLGTGKCIRIMKCVLSGLFPQAAYLGPDGFYHGIRGAVLCISPDSCLYHVQQPKWVVFASVQATGDKTYMRDMMTIEKEWLLETAPHYYKET